MEENAPKIISRKDAKAQGLKRYYTGKTCKRGHVAERQTSDGSCFECHKHYRSVHGESQYKLALEWQNNNRDLVRKSKRESAKRNIDTARQYKKNNHAKVLANAQRYNKENIERRREYRKNAYYLNPTKHRQVSIQRQRRQHEQYADLHPFNQSRVDAFYVERDRLNTIAGYVAYHVDHIHPWSKGGAHHPDNLQILSAEENMRKGAKLNLEEQ